MQRMPPEPTAYYIGHNGAEICRALAGILDPTLVQRGIFGHVTAFEKLVDLVCVHGFLFEQPVF